MSAILENVDPFKQASFSYQNRILRFLWGIIYFLLFRYSPRTAHSWRVFLLSCFGAKIGKHCHVYPSVRIWAPWNLSMCDYSCLGDDVNCYSMSHIKIGYKVVISQGTFLCTGTHDYESYHFQLYALPIVVGDHAWVCSESFICPGVSIGEGSVIGARSVVTKDAPSWTVCAGNPCRSLKPRILKAHESSSFSIGINKK